MSSNNGSNAVVVQTDDTILSDSRNAIVPRKSGADAIEYEGDAAQNLGMAVAQLQQALAGMKPDDVNFEYERDRDGRTKLRFRAYRHK
jgi:hypothetical protein